MRCALFEQVLQGTYMAEDYDGSVITMLGMTSTHNFFATLIFLTHLFFSTFSYPQVMFKLSFSSVSPPTAPLRLIPSPITGWIGAP